MDTETEVPETPEIPSEIPSEILSEIPLEIPPDIPGDTPQVQVEGEEDENKNKTTKAAPEIPQYQKESVLHIVETVPPGDRPLADNMYKAYAPYRYFWKYPCFRIPLLSKKTNDGSYQFRFKIYSPIGLGFITTLAVFIVVAVLITVSSVGLILNFPSRDPEVANNSVVLFNGITKNIDTLRHEELYIMQRNFAPVLILMCALIHIIVADINFYKRKNAVVHYFTFWSNSVELLKIDVAEGVRKFMVKCLFFYGFFIFLLILLFAANFSPVSGGGPALFMILMVRTVYPNVHTLPFFVILRVIGTVFFIYIIWTSKAYVFLLLYKSSILTNAYKEWNDRLERVLHKGEGGKTREEKNETRTGYDHLFKDHVVLLDLIDGTDTLFANTIESYYSTQVVSICFEIYYFYKSQSDISEFSGARVLDGVFIGIYLFHTIVFFFLVTTAAVEVGEEAMRGLDIIRRKGLLGRKSEEEIFFMLSMYMSYAGHFENAISGGNYYTIDKAFFVGIIGTIFSYFIIIIQFTPPLAVKDKNKLPFNTKDLIMKTEQTLEYTQLYPVGF